MRYLDVAEQLRTAIAAGRTGVDGALASEAALAREHGVSRVTVRRALEVLRDEGLVRSRRGAGWFSVVDPVRQSLGRMTTVEAALDAAGVVSTRRILEFAFEAATEDVARALDLDPGAEVLRVRRCTLADGVPFAVVTVWIRADVGATVSRAEAERATFYELLPARGVELGRAVQTIDARVAGPGDAAALGVPAGSPLLVCHRRTEDRTGRPVLVSEHRYPAGRTTFEIEFPSTPPGATGAVPGLRLAAPA